MPPDRRCQFEAHVIHRGKGPVLLSVITAVLSTVQVTVRFGLVPSQLLGNKPGVEVTDSLLFPFQPFERTWGSTNIHRVFPGHTDTRHLQTSMSSLGLSLSLSLNPRSYGKAVSVIIHYTGGAYVFLDGVVRLKISDEVNSKSFHHCTPHQQLPNRSSFDRTTNYRVELICVKSVEAQSPLIGVVWKFGELAQMSLS
ncbi:hypothetical protein TNCV_2140721 [Trichonephila clavipes]|uniref:Uncharacterized protein n=1 Tax=Trichonephila clavipes TaxID=2585209 RepID=A0A8X6S541_TRICX|nr:hypothetical protein TNCV_2140721 [Trichonephila clavipes]